MRGAPKQRRLTRFAGLPKDGAARLFGFAFGDVRKTFKSLNFERFYGMRFSNFCG
jgi:hypothetical protein